jgi:hypothetical protein
MALLSLGPVINAVSLPADAGAATSGHIVILDESSPIDIPA